MTELTERYLEQLSTTAETLRRRFVSYYDGIFVVGERVAKAAERTREIAEPASYDFRDHVVNALGQTEPISTLSKDWKNTLVETYLGISVLTMGISYGQLAGVYALSGIMDRVFDSYVELGLLVLVPIYAFLSIRKTAALDEMERRSVLFAMCLSLGILSGHLWPSTTSMAPSVYFITPLVFALLVDNEIISTPLPDLDRQQFFALGAALATTLSLLAGPLPLGYLSTTVFLSAAIHSLFFVLHFQLTCQANKDKTFTPGESQFAYLVVIFCLQMLFSDLFGVNPLVQEQSPVPPSATPTA